MSQLQRGMNISNLVIQCSGLASVIENSLGPHGRAVLMERSGNVTITRDGIELLTSLSVGDPVLSMVTRGVVDHSQICGDGSKRMMLLLRCLMRSLDYHVSSSIVISEAVRRQKMLQIIQYLRKYLLCRVQRQVFECGVQMHPLHNIEALGEILSYAAGSFLHTKFSKLIGKTLTELFKSYIICQCSSSDDALKLIENAMNNTRIAIVEIYNTPLLKSNVSPGFVVTRDFKHLDQGTVLEDVPCILWSIELEEIKEGAHNCTVNVSDSESLMESLMIRNSALCRCLSRLKSVGTAVIFSSVFFPDWAILMCKKYGFSVIDMIDTDEWNFMLRKFRVIPVTCLRDIEHKSIVTLIRIESVTLGNSRFIRLHGLNVHQIILCGPTAFQCKQFSSAFCKLFRYLHHWMMDCLYLHKSLSDDKNLGANSGSNECCYIGSSLLTDSYYLTIVNSHSATGDSASEISSFITKSNPLPLFYSVPPGEYIALLAKLIVIQDKYQELNGLKETALSVVVALLNEIPALLFRKSRLPQDRFIHFNTTFNKHGRRLVDELDCYCLTDFMNDLHLDGHESPFVFFRILDSVFTFAQFILRIECIIPSKHRLSQKLKGELESSDEEIE